MFSCNSITAFVGQRRWRHVWFAIAAALFCARTSFGQFEYETAPIHYATAAVDEPASRLAEKLARGEVKLQAADALGRLRELLSALDVPVSSQALVFSKTSFQRELIRPDAPRAIYFADDVYVGYVQRSDVIEVTAVDPALGPVFYTFEARNAELRRQNHDCTQCHASALTRGTPGHIVRSVYPDKTGLPLLRNGSFLTDHRSPIAERWGGWYVTGTHGRMRHLGNQVFDDETPVERIDREPGANVTSLEGRFDSTRYLSPHSDIVALMVLEHQTMVQNQITQSVYQARYALRDADAMNTALGRPAEFLSESITRRITNAAEAMVKVILLQDEAPLTDRIQGTSGFAEEFAARGPFDRHGRSLRQLALERRLFQFPCSYVIYCRAIDEAPAPLKSAFFRRLHEVLQGSSGADDYKHLTAADRTAIREILSETLPAFRDNAAPHRAE